MPKAGKQFELVVSDVVKEMDPDSTVRRGEWIEGPDGHRELDVFVEGTVDGVSRRIHIECKDYDPDSRPIGVAHIDALDSKHRDLKFDASLLCSNAGFTQPAIKKAKRLGIGLIGVLRKGDKRIRYRIFDEIYVRRVNFVPNSANINIGWVEILPDQGNLGLEEILFESLPVFNWIKNRMFIFVASNPIVKGTHLLSFRFKHPVEFSLPIGFAAAKSVSVEFKLTGGWVAQRVQIDATCGLYDWIRQTIRRAPGAGKLVFKDVKIGKGGNPINCPPDFHLYDPAALNAGEISMWILDMGGYDSPKEIPSLDQFVVDEDLESIRKDLPREVYYTKLPTP